MKFPNSFSLGVSRLESFTVYSILISLATRSWIVPRVEVSAASRVAHVQQLLIILSLHFRRCKSMLKGLHLLLWAYEGVSFAKAVRTLWLASRAVVSTA